MQTEDTVRSPKLQVRATNQIARGAPAFATDQRGFVLQKLREAGERVRRLNPWFSDPLHKTFVKGEQKRPWSCTECLSAECLNLSVSRPGRGFGLCTSDLPWRDKVAELRGQLTLIVHRAEQGLPVSIESLVRAERVARSLELAEGPV